MPDQDVDALDILINRIVAGAHIPSRAERDDLRRELHTHFEEGAPSPDREAFAIRRFGPEELITESLRRVYRWDYLAAHVVRLAASTIASFAAALVILALVNLRVEIQTEVWRLTPGFSRAAGVALAVVLGIVAVQEAMRRPSALRAPCWRSARTVRSAGSCRCSSGTAPEHSSWRRSSWCSAIVLEAAVAAAALDDDVRPVCRDRYAIHARLAINFAPSRAAIASAALVACGARRS